jgi:hypothetical protein
LPARPFAGDGRAKPEDHRGHAKMMKSKAVGVVAVILAATVPRTASAAVLLTDNFDFYFNQAAFESVWTPIGIAAPESGALSTSQAASPPQSVHNPGTIVNNQSRNRRTFPETPVLSIGSQLVWSFDFFDSFPGGNPVRNFSNLQDTTAPASANQLVAMGLNNNQTSANSGGQYYMARILGYTVPLTPDPDGGPIESVGGAGAFFKLNDFGAPHRTAGWHNFKAIISTDDGTSTDYEFYVDGALAERVSNVGAQVRQYDNIALGSGLSNGNSEVYFDNVNLEFIEPFFLGDFNDDFIINLTDYLILVANLHTDVSQLLPAQSYPLGNITGDREINGHDFLGFAKAFDDFNGVGAFQAMQAAIPEPTTGALAALGAAGIVVWRKKRAMRRSPQLNRGLMKSS